MYTVLKKSHSIYKFELVILLTKMTIFIFFPTTVIEYSHSTLMLNTYKTKRNFKEIQGHVIFLTTKVHFQKKFFYDFL